VSNTLAKHFVGESKPVILKGDVSTVQIEEFSRMFRPHIVLLATGIYIDCRLLEHHNNFLREDL
jgi:hypothetical protein